MNDRIPAEVFPPGDFLAEELEERGWSQTELAEILGRPPRLVNEIIANKRAVTPETAKGLAAAFGSSAQYWMNLESSYQLSKTKIEEREVSRRAKLYASFPVKELIKRGWIEFSENIDVLEQRFFDYFHMTSWDDVPTFACAAKKTDYATPSSKMQLAWLNRAAQVAQSCPAKRYSEKALQDAVPRLRECMEYVDEIKNVAMILAEVGVRLVIVEHLPGAKMDGACFWIEGGRAPVIALSLRFDRVDNFWFCIFHEIDHILHGEGKEDAIYEEIKLDAENLPPNEARANLAAADYCIPRDEMVGFIARHNPLFTKQSIIGFARRLRVHPGVVVGQLHHGVIPYSFHRELLERIRTAVTTSAMTDGFGNKLAL